MAFFLLTRFVLVKYSRAFVERPSQGTSSLALQLTTVSLDKCTVHPSKLLIELYKKDINFESLETQLSMLPDFVKTRNELNKQETPTKRITSVYTIVI